MPQMSQLASGAALRSRSSSRTIVRIVFQFRVVALPLNKLSTGVFGGYWCTWFHTFHAEKTFTAAGNRALKERLVKEDQAHALVFDGDEPVAWAQYGPPGNCRTSITARRNGRAVA
jgi:hypothetical protein